MKLLYAVFFTFLAISPTATLGSDSATLSLLVVEKQLKRAMAETDRYSTGVNDTNTSEPDILDHYLEQKAQPHDLSTELRAKIFKEMIWIEAGSFEMGSNLETAGNREKPAHKVTLDGFYIGQTEVTQELFQAVMGWDNSYFPCTTCPVNNISWFNMQLFINRLNAITSKIFRLPTEAEWAYAAKGGQKSKHFLYSGSNNIDEVAWYSQNAGYRSHPVAGKKPNELGLYDMTGNLWEFCQDTMKRKLFTEKPRVNPIYIPNKDPKHKTMKVLRGGGYEFSANESEVFRRDAATNNVRMPDIGFRLAMSKK